MQLNSLISFTGLFLTPELIRGLQTRGLIEAADADSSTPLYVTEHGRGVTMQIYSQAKSIESTYLSRVGTSDAAAFKNLRKQFIMTMDSWLPHLWEGGSPN